MSKASNPYGMVMLQKKYMILLKKSTMRILIVTPHFHPEILRVNDLAADFINRGHSVSVLTSIPNYPKGFFYEGYGIFTKNRETYNGIKIYRAPIIPRGSGSNFRLSLNYISYVLGGIFTSIFFIKKKIDVIFIFESSPITVALPAIFVKKIKKIPICIWVLDLWPESVVSGGNIKSNFIPSLLNPLVKFIYDKSDKILVSSNGFVDSVKDKGVNIEKIEYFPQWAEDLFKPVDANFELLPNTVPKESFKIMFAGNIGEAQDFPSIIEAARILKDENIQWLILGDGRKSKWVKEKIKDYKLEKCFHMLGSHPLESMLSYYALSDALLFSLKTSIFFQLQFQRGAVLLSLWKANLRNDKW